MIAAYVRVSTEDQDTGLQERDIELLARSRGWQVSVYRDHGWSGKNTRRPEFQRLVRDIRAGRVDTVVVWKLDRMGRSLVDLVLTLNEWRELGVRVVSIKDSFDLGTPQGRMMAGLLAVFAEYEREMIRERVKAGLKAARAKGVKPGPKPKTHPKIHALRAQGLSHWQIGKQLGMNPGSVYRILKRSQGDGR